MGKAHADSRSVHPVAYGFEGTPPQDAKIMLTGLAKIAGSTFQVTALRVSPGRRGPDYRDEVPKAEYEAVMDAMLEDIEDLVNSTELEPIAIDGAYYLLWMMPSSRT